MKKTIMKKDDSIEIIEGTPDEVRLYEKIVSKKRLLTDIVDRSTNNGHDTNCAFMKSWFGVMQPTCTCKIKKLIV